MLVGYGRQRDRLRELVIAAERGRGGAVVLLGDAGTGKSALCDELCAGAGAGSATVLRARGVAPERGVPFAALRDLVLPVRAHLAALPVPQAAAVGAMLSLDAEDPGDALALRAGVHSLLVMAGPALVVVDDAQWIDEPSLAVLAFVARRVEDAPVALVVAERAEEEARPVLAGVPTLRLVGLTRADGVALLGRVCATADRAVAEQLWSASAGNPAALRDAASTLPPDILQGLTPLRTPVPLGPGLLEHFGAHVRALSERERAAALLVAAGRGQVDVLRAALGQAELDWDAVEVAEREGLVVLRHGHVAFRHPLARAAAYQTAGPAEQRWAHRMLADAERDPDHRAWHLAAAAVGSDETAAQALLEAAGRAQARDGYPEAAEALSAASALLDDPARRLVVQLDAAQAWHLSGAPARALATLDAAMSATHDPVAHATVQEIRAGIELWLGNPRAARDLLRAEADRVEAADAVVAARLRIIASMPSTMIGEVEVARALVRTAWEVLAGTPLEGLCAAALGAVELLLGEYATGRSHVQHAADLLDPEASEQVPTAFFLVQGLRLAGSGDEATELVHRVIAQGRRHRAPGLLPLPLAMLADIHVAFGRPQEARMAAGEAVELCDAVGHLTERCHALAVLARAEADLGAEAARRHAEEVPTLTQQTGAVSMDAYAHHALGVLALARQRYEDAIPALERARDVCLVHGAVHPGIVPWAPDLVEALMAVGRRHAAAQVLDTLEGQAAALGSPWIHGLALRSRGLLGGDDAESVLAQALDLLPTDRLPYHAARTQLVLGELLRRRNRRQDARPHLRGALETFARLGAVPWAERARAELRAAGGRTRPAAQASLGALTPQELRIAQRVAAGETNSEVAAALHLSRKTVENRLTAVYAKLGIRSRTELAGLVDAAQ